jgi:hypothetical protein
MSATQFAHTSPVRNSLQHAAQVHVFFPPSVSHTGFCEDVGGGTVSAAAKGVELSDTTIDVSDGLLPRMFGSWLEDETPTSVVDARKRWKKWPGMVRTVYLFVGWIFWWCVDLLWHVAGQRSHSHFRS